MGNDTSRSEQRRQEGRYMSESDVAKLLREQKRIYEEEVQETINKSNRGMSPEQVQELLQKQKKSYEARIQELQKQTSINNATSASLGIVRADVEKLRESQKKEYEAKLMQLTQTQQRSTAPSAPPAEPSTSTAWRSQYSYDRETLQQVQKSNPLYPSLQGVNNNNSPVPVTPTTYKNQGPSHKQSTSFQQESIYNQGPSTSKAGTSFQHGNSPFASTIKSPGSTSNQSDQSGSSGRRSNDGFLLVNKNNKGRVFVSNPSNAPNKTYSNRPHSNVRDRSSSSSNRPHANGRDRSSSRHSTYRNTGDENTNCRTCGNRYELTIFQCGAGHSSCKSCKVNGLPCGICMGRITDMRNIALEEVVGQIKVPCKNDGCKLNLRMMDMEIHEVECPFKDLVCPLSVFFGNCTWRGKLSNLYNHFEICHPDNCKADVDKEMYLFNIRNQSRNLHLVKLGSFNFLLHVNLDGQTFKVAVQLIGTGLSAKKWSYDIHMYNKAEPKRKFEYTDTCNTHTDKIDDIFGESRCANIPISYVETFENRGHVNYKFFIKKDADEGKEPKNRRNRKYGRNFNKMDMNNEN